MHEDLPEELVAKVFDALPTKNRARIALVCKAWHEISLQNLNSVALQFSSLEALQKQHEWLEMLGDRAPLSLQSIQMHWLGGKLLHPAAGNLHLDKFINLKRLDLKRPQNNCWLVTPKTLLSWTALTNLEDLTVSFSPVTRETGGISHRVDDQAVTLVQFTIFPKLRQLSITMHPYRGWESGWDLQLSPNFESLPYFESFAIAGLKKVTPTLTLHRIVARLKTLDLSLRESFKEELDAPCMESLKYLSLGSTCLPFNLSQNCKELYFTGSELPDGLLENCHSLSSLSYGETMNGISETQAEFVGKLKELKELKLLGFFAENQHELLRPLCELSKLEFLELRITGPDRLFTNFSSCGHLMKNLKVLGIQTLTYCQIELCNSFSDFPALEVLSLELHSLKVPIVSSTIQELRLNLSTCLSLSLKDSNLIGDLPALRKLSLKGDMHIREVCLILTALRNSNLLSELYIQKRSHWLSYSPSWTDIMNNMGGPQHEDYDMDIIHNYEPGLEKNEILAQEDRNFVEVVLQHCCLLKNLKVLQLAAVNNDVQLTSAILPAVRHLGLACRHLALCDSCSPWPQSSLQLLFVKASVQTHNLLTSHDMIFGPGKSETLEHFNAIKLHRGELPYEFPDDLWVDNVEPDLLEHTLQHQMFPFDGGD